MSEIISSKSILNEVVRFIENALGLRPGEEFRVSGSDDFRKPVTVRGLFTTAYYLSTILRHPEVIEHIPSLTESERAICKAVGATDINYLHNLDSVWLMKDGQILASVKPSLFPSVKSGQKFSVSGL